MSNIKRFCAYETQPEDGFKIVDRNSATRGCDDTIAIDKNHRDLVKPCSLKSDSYTFLKNKLGEVPSPSSAIPLINSAPSIVPFALPTQSLLSRVEQMKSEIEHLQSGWSQETQYINVEYGRPYKMDRSKPFPTEMPLYLIDRLQADDYNMISSFGVLSGRLTALREASLKCMQLTPNEINRDSEHFQVALGRASRITSVPNLLHDVPDRIRFGDILIYLDELHHKLGDYHCST